MVELVSQAQQVYELGPGISPPVVVKAVYPTTTKSAIAIIVTMACVVGLDGKAGQIKILTSPDKTLNQSAIEALRHWVFKPGTKDGTPVLVRVKIQMWFMQG